MSGLEERLAQYRTNSGDKDLIAFFDRREPSTKRVFIERLYKDLDEALDELVGQAHELVDESETKLRSRILIVLKKLGYRASGETDHRGHTDLLVENSHVSLRWIGEAKKYDSSGYAYLTGGMKQLLTRYTGGTHTHCGFLVFVFNVDAANVLATWVSTMDSEGTCDLSGPPVRDPTAPLRYWSDHKHKGSGLQVRVRHMFTPLYYKPEDVALKSSNDG